MLRDNINMIVPVINISNKKIFHIDLKVCSPLSNLQKKCNLLVILNNQY